MDKPDYARDPVLMREMLVAASANAGSTALKTTVFIPERGWMPTAYLDHGGYLAAIKALRPRVVYIRSYDFDAGFEISEAETRPWSGSSLNMTTPTSGTARRP